PLINVAVFGLVPVPPMPELAESGLRLREPQAEVILPSSLDSLTPMARPSLAHSRSTGFTFFGQIKHLTSLLGCFAGFANLAIAPVCAQQQLFRELPSGANLGAHQMALVELAKTSDAVTGVKVMTTEPQTQLNYILDGGAPAKITLGLTDRINVTVS